MTSITIAIINTITSTWFNNRISAQPTVFQALMKQLQHNLLKAETKHK